MLISIPRETHSAERRVAISPAAAAALVKDRHQIQVERSAGVAAGFTDAQYERAGATIVDNRAELIGPAGMVLQVRTYPANPAAPEAELNFHRAQQIVIGFAEPLIEHGRLKALADRGVTLFAMELIPRVTRAQSMDALSSQASLAGYKAVIRAADVLGKIFPMMMTAAGTIQAARVLVIGAGVAGLQAIATAKRLGAVVTGYDVRPAVKEQVQSLGAKFLELPLETAGAEDKTGYAKDQSEEQVHRQQELMSKAVAEADVVITTALIPGKKAPTLVTAAMVEGMSPGSVIVDLAAERGGNCELTQPGRTIEHNGVIINGEDFNSAAAHHASQFYANNLLKLIKHLVKDDKLLLDPNDEVAVGALVCQGGEILHPKVRESMGLPPRSQ